MLLREIKNIFHKELDALYGKQETDSFFYLLIGHFLNVERFVLAIEPERLADKEEQTKFFVALSELKQNKPIQHILGYTEFMELQFRVGPEVLIPRPETEELVHWILEGCQKDYLDKLNILDMGTGSGCIAVSLAKECSRANVSAMDISEEALQIAAQNAKTNQTKVHFFQADIHNVVLDDKYEIIVSNPPYVRELEKSEMHDNVKIFEPGIALFVPDKEPLVFYESIARFANHHLVSQGSLYLEINQYFGKEMVGLLEKYNFKNIELRKDMFGNNRMIKGTKG